MLETNAAIIDVAFKAAEAKDKFAAALRKLDRAAAQILIAQLMLEFSAVETAKEKQVNGAGPKPVKPARLPAQGELTQALLHLLRESPHMSFADLAERLYGGRDADTQKKVRSLMNAQRKKGTVRNVGSGKWEAVTS